MMSETTENAVMAALADLLADHSDNDVIAEHLEDIGDALHTHFTDFQRWDWCEIADETRRIWNLMFKERVEPDSPMDAVWTAAVAQAYDGGIAAVAAALGVDRLALREVVAHWYEHQDELPPPITAELMLKRCEEAVIARHQRMAFRAAKGKRHG